MDDCCSGAGEVSRRLIRNEIGIEPMRISPTAVVRIQRGEGGTLE
jgi:hypothetical protein